MKKNLLRRKGFTLIELLVVIAIISLIASIVLASLSEARAQARDTQRINDIRQLRNALELYRLSADEFPPEMIGDPPVINYSCAGGDTSDFEASLSVLVDNNLIPEIPTDPINNISSGNCYAYVAGTSLIWGEMNDPETGALSEHCGAGAPSGEYFLGFVSEEVDYNLPKVILPEANFYCIQ